MTWWSDPYENTPAQDGSGSGVFARRLSPTGEFMGPEFQVNTFTAGHQFPGSVAAAPDGRFVILWESVGQDGSDGGIYGQRFSPAGEKVGPEFRVNQHTESWQERPDVAMDLEGNFTVVWESFEQDGSAEGVYARRFDSDGRALGDEFRVNTTTFSYQELPRIAMDSAGNFVVVWLDWFSGPSFPDVVGRAFRPDGSPAGPEFPVNAYQLNDQDFPDVALADTGTMVAVWQSFGQDSEIYHETWGVFGRRFATPFPSTCVPSEVTLCLGGGRFRVEADWEIVHEEGRDVDGSPARALPLTDDTGAFSFFNPNNLELLVKVLDGCPANDRFWVFAGGLTNVSVRLTVVDTATGEIRVWRNPAGHPFQPVQDTAAFATCAAPFAPRSSGEGEEPAEKGAARAASAVTCQADLTHLCLGGGRYEVSASWRTPAGESGVARVLPLTHDSGAFWFFNPANLELLVKVLDACPVNGRIWTFAGGLTDVEVELTVRDTLGGGVRTYHNPPATPFQPILDTDSFPACGSASGLGARM